VELKMNKRNKRRQVMFVSAFLVAALIVGFGSNLTNMVPSMYRFSTIDSRIPKALASATGPLRVSPDNPRYFTDGSGKAIYLTGSHTWSNFQDSGDSDPPPVFDYTKYLDFMEAKHHNFFRLWNWEQAKWQPWSSLETTFDPLPYLRPGPGIALDKKPKFDFTRFNQGYFDRLRSRIIAAKERGIYVSIMLFDGWSIENKGTGPGNPWPGHPLNRQNNINGIDGDLNHNGMGEETHTLQSATITSVQKAYLRKVIDTVNDLDNVLYEISNESPSDSQNWQYEMIEYIKEYEAGKPKQHPVGMTVEYPNGSNNDLINSPADWISPNDAQGYKNNPPAATGSKVILVDTDHLWGIGGDRQWMWKSFTRGINPIFMDCYNKYYCEGNDPNDPTWESLRLNMGYALTYANRINLAEMTPRVDLCSSGYCLANPTSNGTAEYLVYLPSGSEVNIDLSAVVGQVYAEWMKPENGRIYVGSTVSGGAVRRFRVPFFGDAVLYLSQMPLTSIPEWKPDFHLFFPFLFDLNHQGR
jgi:hypothetical protein